MRKVIPAMAAIGLSIVLAFSTSLVAMSGTESTSTLYLIPGDVATAVGGLIFESGSRLALEVVGAEDSACFDLPVLVERMDLTDAAGRLLRSESYSPAIDAAEWIGRLPLVDDQGSPFPEGEYEVTVSSSVARFSVGFGILEASRFAELGHSSAAASICGVSLRVYRLVTEAEAGTSVAMRVGDRLMVDLEGNPTTGYTWENTLEYEYAVLRETQEAEFRASSGLLGAGGSFLFRYSAVDVGPQAFRFNYHRPWESTEPERTVTFDVEVY
jgi:inhibitor of cysteine peptidase